MVSFAHGTEATALQARDGRKGTPVRVGYIGYTEGERWCAINTPPVVLIVERAVRAATSPGSGAVEELIDIAQGRRAPLETAHTVLVGRLHRRPDDFDATAALLLVIRALQQVGHTPPVVAEAAGHHRKQRKGTGASSR